MKNKKENKVDWAIGGGLMLGLGVGFFFLRTNALAFIGSLFSGIGLGLITTAIISKK